MAGKGVSHNAAEKEPVTVEMFIPEINTMLISPGNVAKVR
jgi:hypothetical protein